MLRSLLLLVFALAPAVAGDPPPGIGEKAPGWAVESWVNCEPVTLADLDGQVVLVRFWTAPSCPYCRNSAPALAHFAKAYRDDGLRVVALYHHKAPSPLDPAQVADWAKEYGFTFPVGIDAGWRTLRRWWLDRPGNDAAWTSVSFLIDRKGIIRHIHPGGQYVKGDDDYAAMEAAIKKWTAE